VNLDSQNFNLEGIVLQPTPSPERLTVVDVSKKINESKENIDSGRKKNIPEFSLLKISSLLGPDP
jgi:hypothetical protein